MSMVPPMPRAHRREADERTGRASALRRGARVLCSDDERPVGRLEGWITTDRGDELLVRSGWWDPVVRRVLWSAVARASLGMVALEGELDSPRDIELAVSVAAAVPGVVTVENRLCSRWSGARPTTARAAPPDGRLVLIDPRLAWRPWRYAGRLLVAFPRPSEDERRGCD